MALVIEYEGTAYHGFQYQTNASTIQEELEKAITRFTREAVRIKGAGRTDAGVHAEAQVVAFDTGSPHQPDTVVQALNFYLPDDIAVKAAYRVAGDFDPRRMAVSRRYRYSILNGPTPSPMMRRTAHLVARPLEVRKMREAARLLVGRHDFARFAGPLSDGRTSTVREIYEARVRKVGDVIIVEVEGNSFLPHQVRRMTGALVDVGKGSLSQEGFRSIINGGPGEHVAHALPARGLCLVKVSYSGFPPKVGELDDD